LSFDGVDDYVEVKHADSLNLNYMSLALWLKWKSPMDNWPILINKGGKFYLQLADTKKLYFLIRSDGSSYYIFSNTILAENTWYFVVATYDGSYMKIYINGNLDNSLPVSITVATTTANLRIGGETYSGSRFGGLIDEVRIYNRALSEEEIRYLYNRGAPIAHWKFDEGKGNIAYDSSGNGNNGTIYGAQWVQGKFGSALSFDGVDDYVGVPHSSSLMVTTKFTLSAWVRTSLTGRYQYVIAKRAGGGGTKGYGLLFDPNGQIYGVIDDGTGANITVVSGNWADGKFHHVAYVRDDGVQRIYVDGILRATTNYVIGDITNTEPLKIGIRGDNINPFSGLIDDVRIYNYARSPEQILQDYNAGLSAHFK
jgi:hypothetical protein